MDSDLSEFLGIAREGVPGRVSDPKHHCCRCGEYIEKGCKRALVIEPGCQSKWVYYCAGCFEKAVDEGILWSVCGQKVQSR